MAEGRRRQVAPVRKLVAAVLGTFATFVILFGFGMKSWAIAVLGVALLALAIGLVAITAVRSGPRAWVTGIGHVHSVTEPPASSAFGRCELQIVIDAPGVPARSVKIRDPRVPVSKWPDPGATLPIMVAIDDQRHVRILWDEVLTHAEAAASGDLPPAFDDLDPLGDDILIEQEAPPWAQGGRDEPYPPPRPTGPTTDDLAEEMDALRDELEVLRDERGTPREDPVVMRQTPGGTIVLEGTLVDPPSTAPLPRRPRPGPGPGGRTRRPSPTPTAATSQAPPAARVTDPPTQDAPTRDGPAQEAPAQEDPTHDEPAQDGPTHDGPTHDGPTHDGPTHDAPAHDAPAHDAPAHDAPVQDARIAEMPAPEAPVADPSAPDVPPTRPPGRDDGSPTFEAGSVDAPSSGSGPRPAPAPTADFQVGGAAEAGPAEVLDPDPPVPVPESGPASTPPPLDDIDIPLDDPEPAPGPRAGPEPRAETPGTSDDEAILADLTAVQPPARLGGSGSISGVGITLLVADLDRSIAFYRDLLGFFEIDGGEGNAILASGATRLVLRAIREVAPINRRLVHLNLEVNDVNAVYEELLAKGVKFTYAPRAVNRGAKLELWAAAFRDPDGHGIALTQWRDRPTG